MDHTDRFYINGAWVAPSSDRTIEVLNPATEEVIASVPAGTAADVDAAVAAARGAFAAWSQLPAGERAAWLSKLATAVKENMPDIGATISREMGMPRKLAVMIQAGLPAQTLANYAALAETFEFETERGSTRVVKEPIGVCGFITPWNYPLHQIVGKVAPALAAGCTMVLKPSEVAPLNAILFAEICDAVGLPAGVFNLVHGDGPTVGAAIAAHPGVDMVSFTGSTRAGVQVAVAAADTVKRVTQELGGKSANIILDDADLKRAVTGGVRSVMLNSGQSCNAPTRMLVQADQLDEAIAIAREAAESQVVGDPADEGTHMGPVVNESQYRRVLSLIERGIEEGATLVTGGTERPDGLTRGYFVRPTVFAGVSNDMTIAREEIFGPVLAIIAYEDEQDAIRIANDSPYGLAGYVQSGDIERARRVARQIRAGQIQINGARHDAAAPFGGYKQSGNGREFGEWGLDEFLEVKSLVGYDAA
jgi:aldehyde dehydrogenase (NAD+)